MGCCSVGRSGWPTRIGVSLAPHPPMIGSPALVSPLQAFDEDATNLIGVVLAILVVLATVYLKFVSGPSDKRGGGDTITATGFGRRRGDESCMGESWPSGASRLPFVPSSSKGRTAARRAM